MKCSMKFSMGVFKWHCETHDMVGDELGCLAGAREHIAELEAAQPAVAADPPTAAQIEKRDEKTAGG